MNRWLGGLDEAGMADGADCHRLLIIKFLFGGNSLRYLFTVWVWLAWDRRASGTNPSWNPENQVIKQPEKSLLQIDENSAYLQDLFSQ